MMYRCKGIYSAGGTKDLDAFPPIIDPMESLSHPSGQLLNPFIAVLKCLMSAQCRDVGEPSCLNLPFAVLYVPIEMS